MTDAAPILLFGGTFDPPTRAHSALPAQAAKLIGAQRLLFVPAAISPHKLDRPPTPPAHRVTMLELALRDLEGAEIRTLELEREGPSFTIDTVRAIRSEFGPDTPLHFLIGDDQAESFHRWQDCDELLALSAPVVLPRRHGSVEAFARAMAESGGNWSEAEVRTWCDRRLDLPCMTMSSTDVRNRLESGDDADDTIDPLVLDYIRTHALYA